MGSDLVFEHLSRHELFLLQVEAFGFFGFLFTPSNFSGCSTAFFSARRGDRTIRRLYARSFAKTIFC